MIEKYTYSGLGYNPYFSYGEWQVAQLNYADKQGFEDVEKLISILIQMKFLFYLKAMWYLFQLKKRWADFVSLREDEARYRI